MQSATPTNVTPFPSIAERAVDSASTPKYTASVLAGVKAYQALLKAGRYHKVWDAASPFPRLISAENWEPVPLGYIADKFKEFCSKEGYPYPDANPPSGAYLAYDLQAVTGTTFRPKGPEVVRAKHSQHCYVNTYKTFDPQHAPIELSPLFLDFLRRLFPVPEELHTFCQYIAHAILFPEERPSWHLMLPSESGVGKGFLFNDIISPLFSMQTKLVNKFSDVTGRFGSAVLESSVILLLDDCKAGSSSTETQMKSLLSEERVYVEHKGKQGGMVEVYTRIMLASNEDVPTAVEEQTRRWWIAQKLGFCDGLKGKAGQQERQARIKVLAKWLKLPGAIEAVYKYFSTYPLEAVGVFPEFDPKNVPITANFERMVTKSETPEQAFVADFLESHGTKILKLEELQAEFTSQKMGKQSNAEIAGLLTACGYQKDILATPSRGRWWFPASMTKREAEAILMAQPAF